LTTDGYQAFRWTSATGMVGLGDLPGGASSDNSRALGVSGDGSIVVGFGTVASIFDFQAVLWRNGGATERLWDVLMANGVDPSASGWSKLEVVDGISPDGSTLVGYGTRNGNQEAFVAVIPEPSSLALFAIWAIATRRRRGVTDRSA
jgi:uncharacterized membrane protein